MRAPALFLRALVGGLRPPAWRDACVGRVCAASRAPWPLPPRRWRVPLTPFVIPSAPSTARALWTTRALSAPPPADGAREADGARADDAAAAPKPARDGAKYVPPPLDERDLEETFVKGSGPGGQKINKTSSCVVLRHIPSGVVVRCQESRSQHRNRAIARTILQKKLDEIERGAASLIAQEASKARARKARRRRKSVKKHFKSRRDKIMLDD